MTLLESLQHVKDPRRKQGQRFSLNAMLLLIIMSMVCGKYQYREIERFCKNNYPYLKKRLKLKSSKTPSHVTFRELILKLDFATVQQAFHQWSKEYVRIDPGDWLAIDGKTIRSTISDHPTSYQDFVSLVSVFSQKREQILRVEKFHSKKTSEIRIVENILETLDLKDAVFTMDALHCKKNSGNNHRVGKSLHGESQG